MNYFPDEVIEHMFHFVEANKDRNSISLVCKLWYRIERFSRSRVLVGNCYVISPKRVIARFPCLKSLFLKGKPHFADFNLVPHDWGGSVYPWIVCIDRNRVNLEEPRLKRMIVTDVDLITILFPILSLWFSLVVKDLSLTGLQLLQPTGFAGDSDKGILYVLNGCKKLSKLEIRDRPYRDDVLLNDVRKYETMRSLWMSSCKVMMGGCRTLAKRMPRLKVEVINDYGDLDREDDDSRVADKLFVYRTLVGPRRGLCMDIIGSVQSRSRLGFST